MSVMAELIEWLRRSSRQESYLRTLSFVQSIRDTDLSIDVLPSISAWKAEMEKAGVWIPSGVIDDLEELSQAVVDNYWDVVPGPPERGDGITKRTPTEDFDF